tara:strand:- start:2247 stop:2660 length:414 start_codon:yes stop_codon:yes gene_type:complete
VGKGDISWFIDEFSKRRRRKNERRRKAEKIMSDETVKVTETTKEYELQKADLVPSAGEDEPTWANKIAGHLDRFRVIPRLIMLAYIYAFYSATVWFMALPDPTNAQAAFISTIVGAGAAFFGLYVGKPGTSLPKGKK